MSITSIIIEYFSHIPELTLLLGTCVVLLVGVFSSAQSNWTYLLSQLVLILVIYLSVTTAAETPGQYYNGLYIVDDLAVLTKTAMCVLMFVVLVYSRDFINSNKISAGEYYSLALFALLGMLLIASAGHLLMIYLGLELLSLSLYALVAMNRDDSASSEAAIKYFVLGAIASGFLLYGISLMYGLTGTLYLSELLAGINTESGIALIAALIFIVIGIAFKLGAVPFHMWLPDIYQGAALPVTLLVASVPKIAGFMLAVRLLADGLQNIHLYWQQILLLLAVLSLVAGNLIAIAQSNLRRMLAYSTIGHVGYILLAFLVGDAAGYSAALFYTFIYVLMSSAVFGALLCTARMGFNIVELTDLQGLSRQFPWLALLMLLLMFSMAGIPMTVGFYAKLNVLQVVVESGQIVAAVIAVIASVIGAFYYLRVIKLMYFDEGNIKRTVEMPVIHGSLLSVHSLLVVVLFLFPQYLLGLCSSVFS